MGLMVSFFLFPGTRICVNCPHNTLKPQISRSSKMKGQNTEQILEAEENCAELTQERIEFTLNMSTNTYLDGSHKRDRNYASWKNYNDFECA